MLELPKFSFGTAGIGGLYERVTSGDAHDVLQAAWDGGLRYYDTAPHYGQGSAERRLGDFLRDKSGYVLSTKVGRILTPLADPPREINSFVDPLPFAQSYDYTYDGIMRSVEDSHQRLGLNRLDILFVHDIGELTHGEKAGHYFRQLTDSGRKALERLRSDGTVKGIGLGVNEIAVCMALMDRIDMNVILLAGRYSLLDPSAGQSLIPACAARDIALVIGGVFNSGILATGPVEGAHYDYAPAPPHIMEKTARIESICKAHGVPLAAAALAFPTREPQVVSVLIGTAKARSLQRNLALLDHPIPEALWDDLQREGLVGPTP